MIFEIYITLLYIIPYSLSFINFLFGSFSFIPFSFSTTNFAIYFLHIVYTPTKQVFLNCISMSDIINRFLATIFAFY